MVRKFYEADGDNAYGFNTSSSLPSGGRTFEQILEDYHVQLEDNRRDESIKLAAEKYASQYAHQQPDGAVDALECTCKLTDKNHALCPVCDKEEYKKSVEQRNDAIKNVDERTTNKELISFLISPKKPFKINIVRDLFNQYYQEEISLSRLNERLNEIVFYWKQPVHGYSMEDIIALLDWLTKEDSPYAVCYGSETRFATNQDDLTTEQVFEVWNKIYGHIQQPVNDGWVRVDSGELPDYGLVVDVYKSHHNVVEPAARLSTDITGEKWSCEYGHYITHWRLRPEPPKQTV